MKIAILNKYQNKVFRGAETFVFELGKRLSKNNTVDIIDKVNYSELLRGKYDVVIPTNGRFQVILTRIVTWLSGAKMIVSGQSGMGWDDRINIYSLPDTFVALSPVALSWAKRVCPFVKSTYIPNGVDLDVFTPKENRSANRGKTVLAVGAFTDQKRLDLVINAVSKLDGVNLIVAGGGGDRKTEIVDYGLKTLGHERFKAVTVPFDKMPGIYKMADVFTLPSKPSESFGNVLVEALSSGLPVVATRDPVRENIVGDAGLFVDPTDAQEYANALKKALETSWGDRPRKQAMKFSWDKIAKEYEELVEKISK